MAAKLDLLLLRAAFFAAVLIAAVSADFNTDVETVYGDWRVKYLENGNLVQVTMDEGSGSGFRSKQEYLFGRFDMEMKLVEGNSPGTVTAFFLRSPGSSQDEIDFEFLGNYSGEPYVLHTNLYTQGQGNREEQIYLWFDPRLDFHTYTIIWNPQQILFLVDGTPIRVFKNAEEQTGVLYPRNKPMRLYASIWNGDEWATRQGRVKIDWSYAPFVAYYRNLRIDACVSSSGTGSCSKGEWWGRTLDAAGSGKLRWVREKYMIYDYCQDKDKYPNGFPAECSFTF